MCIIRNNELLNKHRALSCHSKVAEAGQYKKSKVGKTVGIQSVREHSVYVNTLYSNHNFDMYYDLFRARLCSKQ